MFISNLSVVYLIKCKENNMCGIFCCVSNNTKDSMPMNLKIEDMMKRRGPDRYESLKFQVNDFNITLAASVLHMQGVNMAPQPAVSETGNVLAFNGEIFSGIKIEKDESDTAVLLNTLNACDSNEDIRTTLQSIEGPWSFLFYHNALKKLWFGRDYFGRRSLLISQSFNQLTLSSVTERQTDCNCSWNELVPGLYCIDLSMETSEANLITDCISSCPWMSLTNENPKAAHFNGNDFSSFNNTLISPVRSVYLQNSACFPSAVPSFSHLSQTSENLIDLLVQACDEKNLWPSCKFLSEKLCSSIRKRVSTLAQWKSSCNVGILFSGGIDCTVLALLAHKYVSLNESIDLLNVAFERKQAKSNIKKKVQTTDTMDYSVPDRITGISSYIELCSLCPERKWNFVEINVPIDELKAERTMHVADLTYPKDTVLDDSIACALWFASRGKGILKTEDGSYKPYVSSAKILLCGMGADEQLGGYSRHRGIFDNSKDWQNVDDEIKMEIERISSRNLGRDDRIISDHGREARFPYLDEEVVAYLSSLPTNHKADFGFCRGVGEKIILRGAAYLLGLRSSAVLPKRAIQFGSRIAKAEAGKEKGNDSCTRLKAS